MRPALLLLLVVSAGVSLADDFRIARPGYRHEFPRDHFAHPEFRTEWWYYTGNLTAAGGRRFGFELTFFRQAVDRPENRVSAWQIDDVYLAHLALSDLDGGRFYNFERLNRAGPGLAGASLEERRIWNGNWQVVWEDEDQQLQAVAENFALILELRSRKPPVLHGKDGVSRKSAGEGSGSHYISLTRLEASGRLELDGQPIPVSGLAWMDHEFFTNELAPDQVGWDWVYAQLDDGSELMIYQLRRKDGSVDPYSAGTYVPREGPVRHLGRGDYRMTPGRRWRSPATGASYPLEWRIEVPALGLELNVTTSLDSQELVSRNRIGPSYWEGAVEVSGSKAGQPVMGRGYLELTGYAGKVRFGEPRPESGR